MLALGEVQPKFGADNQELQTLYANGIVPYGREFEDVSATLSRLVEQTRSSERTPIMSVRIRRGEEGGVFSSSVCLCFISVSDVFLHFELPYLLSFRCL